MENRFKYRFYCSIQQYQYLMLIAILLIINPSLGNNRESKGIETVVIDAGHGGKDPGAVVGRVREKDIVLAIALRLGDIIRERLPDVRVIYTRTSDTFIPLYERSVIANKNNADLFISIHANYCASASIKGTETYVLGLHRTEDNLNVAKKENSVILLEKDYTTRYEGFDPNLSESYIMFELIQDTNIDQSVSFAGILQDSFHNNAQRANRDVRQAGFLVLRETTMPGVLIETGYLSNHSEANYLMTDAGRKAIAMSIFNSFKLYKGKFESRLNLTSTDSKKPRADLSITAHSEQAPAEIGKNNRNSNHAEREIKNQNTIDKEVKKPATEVDQIIFAIQISASPKKLPLNSTLFKGIENISETLIDEYFKYYCLETASFSTAKQDLQAIRMKIPGAFIIAFKNGKPIPLKDALNSK